jgi:hypothetical protein
VEVGPAEAEELGVWESQRVVGGHQSTI